jgi:hypothetical protein
MYKSILFAILFSFAGLGFASKEGVLALYTFHVESPGIGESGPVSVSGRQSKLGIDFLIVKAFGKVFQLNREQLNSLQGGSLNGIQLTYEGGYKELGGRTIYLQFSKGFTNGILHAIVFVLTEDGKINIKPIRHETE